MPRWINNSALAGRASVIIVSLLLQACYQSFPSDAQDPLIELHKADVYETSQHAVVDLNDVAISDSRIKTSTNFNSAKHIKNNKEINL